MVVENAAIGTVAGTVSADDEDAHQSVHFSLTDSSFSVLGDKVIVNGPINFELSPVLTLLVTATDNGLPPLSVSVMTALKYNLAIFNESIRA